MIFRQLFERESSTYTYLIANRPGGEALLVDPVLSEVDKYVRLLEELEVRLAFAVDTHVHADHVTGLGTLRDATRCATIMGEQTRADCVSRKVTDGETIRIDGLELTALYTPGHTDDSYSFRMGDRVFTGDTLLIRGTGRTDFQNGDARAQYDSLFGRLLTLPDETLVYPAHDYKGWTVSTIGEEKRHNPRLQVGSVDEYVRIMDNLGLDRPRLMDVAVPANLSCGLDRDEPADGPPEGFRRLDAAMAFPQVERFRVVDVRSAAEFTGELGHVDGAELVPLQDLPKAAASWRRDESILLVCRSGARSGRGCQLLRDMGFEDLTNLEGGMIGWNASGLPTEHTAPIKAVG